MKFLRLRRNPEAEMTDGNGKDFLECLKKDSQTSESILRKHTRQFFTSGGTRYVCI